MRTHIYILALAMCTVSADPSWAQTQSQQDNSASQTATAKQTGDVSTSAQTPTPARATKAAKQTVVFTNENLKDPAGDQALSSNSSLPGTAATGVYGAASPVIYSDDSIALPRQHWVTMFDRDGTPSWSVEVTPGDLGVAALGEDGTIYTSDGISVYAVDRNGTIDWKYPAAAGTCCIGSPATDMDGTIYFTGARSLSALQRDGRLKWSISSKHAFESGPALVADGSIYLSATDGLVAFGPDGTEKWVAASPTALTTPAIAEDGTAYFVCGYIWICAVQGINSPLMKSSWPRIYHDSANTGNILTQF